MLEIYNLRFGPVKNRVSLWPGPKCHLTHKNWALTTKRLESVYINMAEVVCNPPKKKLGFIQANPLLEVEETTKDVDLTPSKKAIAFFSVAIQVSSGDPPPDPHGSSLHVLWVAKPHECVWKSMEIPKFSPFSKSKSQIIPLFSHPSNPKVPRFFPENPI
jgi:hypothetical protein